MEESVTSRASYACTLCRQGKARLTTQRSQRRKERQGIRKLPFSDFFACFAAWREVVFDVHLFISGPASSILPMKVILASRSPRRLTLLKSAGFIVEVRPTHIDETPLPEESVTGMVARLSRSKALACDAATGVLTDTPIIAADTLVAIGNHVLGQPRDAAHAKTMLRQLSGHEHLVITGVCVRLGDRLAQQHVVTRVRFRALTDNEIDTYLAHNDVLDKAGAYAVQAGAASFIESIQGPLDNVIGLPVRCTLNLLRECKYHCN